jgi:hypothetical protein
MPMITSMPAIRPNTEPSMGMESLTESENELGTLGTDSVKLRAWM